MEFLVLVDCLGVRSQSLIKLFGLYELCAYDFAELLILKNQSFYHQLWHFQIRMFVFTTMFLMRALMCCLKSVIYNKVQRS